MRDLQAIYDQYVVSQVFYRIVPKSQIKKILSNGFDPNTKPFQKLFPILHEFYKIPLRLYKEGCVMMHWWGFWADQKRVIQTKRQDMKQKYIDFCNKYDIPLYTPLRGGALVWATYLLAKEMIDKNFPLTQSEKHITLKVLKWAESQLDDTSIIQISATNSCFEDALLRYDHNTYLPSPFGTFAHFRKIISTYGLKKYLPYLSHKKRFFIRCKSRISGSALRIYK